MGTAIAVTSGKGGTGKTFLTGGVSSCLAALGRRVLCIDTDVGLRNLDLVLGLADRTAMDFSDVLAGRCSLERALVPHPDMKGLFLLAAPQRPLPDAVFSAGMGELLDRARTMFDYCLIDGPAGLGAGFRFAVGQADRAIVVTTMEAASLRDAQQAIWALGDLGITRRHLVVNRLRPRCLKKLGATIDDAMDFVGLPLLGVVPEDERVLLAGAREVPLLLAGKSRAAAAC
ncbi:MAG: AAA family ATPase, partial [Oscillospiraceae bacterium]|nr:AAA family ATPase [Oscillospiraceae bacterium]